MRPSRLLVVVGVAGAAVALFLAALSTDIELVEDLAGTPVPTIWGTFARCEQVLLLVALGIAALVAVFFRRSRVGALVILAAAVTGAVLVWQGRADAISAAEALAADLDGAVQDGLIAWSPGAGAGPGFEAALAAWGVAAVGALWGIASRGPAGDSEETEPGVAGTVEEPRYLDVVIDNSEDDSVRE